MGSANLRAGWIFSKRRLGGNPELASGGHNAKTSACVLRLPWKGGKMGAFAGGGGGGGGGGKTKRQTAHHTGVSWVRLPRSRTINSRKLASVIWRLPQKQKRRTAEQWRAERYDSQEAFSETAPLMRITLSRPGCWRCLIGKSRKSRCW
jgi:hypothetical protein